MFNYSNTPIKPFFEHLGFLKNLNYIHFELQPKKNGNNYNLNINQTLYLMQ
jgi:hypothetical protein